ncbi:MAG: hypothetical protein ACPGWR_07010 [Ardenticatenaceae bacterium]
MFRTVGLIFGLLLCLLLASVVSAQSPVSQPIELNPSASDKSIRVGWTWLAPLSGDLDHYRLYRNAGTGVI